MKMCIKVLLGVLLSSLVLAGNSIAAASVPSGMVLVPAGKFIMGTTRSDRQGLDVPRAFDDARPQHIVVLPAFYIDRTEVTNAQYKEFCIATHYPVPPGWENGTYPAGQSEYPVTRVSWYEASAFARWAGKRLPTEAEWEKAARGNDGRIYPWGDEWKEEYVVWGRSKPAPVASKPKGASPCGALDMAGNVFEWTSDWYAAYPRATVKFEEYNKTLKVVRGGGYYGLAFLASTFYRSVDVPAARSEWIGFRCVKEIPKDTS